MNTLKKISLPLISLFLCYRSIELTKSLLLYKPKPYSTIEGLILSFLLTLFITGIFAFIGFAYPTNKILPDSYYKIKSPQKLNRFYKVLGVKFFQAFLLYAFWGWKNNRKKYFNGTKRGLANFVFQTKQSEFGHLAAFAVILIVSLILLFHNHIFLFVSVTLLNIIGNFYPIILQRYHRMRIEKISRSNSIKEV